MKQGHNSQAPETPFSQNVATGSPMPMVSVSEAALDSIQRMGEADKAEIKNLRWTLKYIASTLTPEPTDGEALAFKFIREAANQALRVNTDSQTIVSK